MSSTANVMKRTRQGGQTLIIALLILGVLLILGFVFLGLISRNIATAGRANQRSIGNDLKPPTVKLRELELADDSAVGDHRNLLQG